MNNISQNNTKTLLPQGFHDILAPLADVERAINKTILDNFRLFGYKLVRPAMLEFEDENSLQVQASFRVTDPISGKMLSVRTDITPQISRIATDRFDDIKGLKRLSYTGQVIRKQGKGRQTERQLTQTGIELLGGNKLEQDAEILFIALDSLHKIKVTEYTVDFSLPSLAAEILDAQQLNDTQKSKIISLIERKDFAALEQASQALILKILDICSRSTTENYADIISEISALKISDASKQLLSDLQSLITKMLSEGLKFNLTIDLLEIKGFEYHSGICFSIFSNKTLEEICRGGRYFIQKDSTRIDATGFTFLVNSLCRIANFSDFAETKKQNYKDGFSKSAGLREQGIITVFE